MTGAPAGAGPPNVVQMLFRAKAEIEGGLDVQALWDHGMQELNLAVGPMMDLAEGKTKDLDITALLTHLVGAQYSFDLLAQGGIISQWTVPLAQSVGMMIEGLENQDNELLKDAWNKTRVIVEQVDYESAEQVHYEFKEQVDYEFYGLPSDHRARLARLLDATGIPFSMRNLHLVVDREHESEVDKIIDSLAIDLKTEE
jgi:hypothetical protein